MKPYRDWVKLKVEGEAGGYTLRQSNSGASILAVFIADTTNDPAAGSLDYLSRVDAWLKSVTH